MKRGAASTVGAPTAAPRVRDPASALACVVRAERIARGLTQRQLAEAAGMHPMAVSKIELGRVGDVGTETLRWIAAALSSAGTPLSAAKLLDGAERLLARSYLRIAFLDIDGVCNSTDYLRDNPGAFDHSRPDFRRMFDPQACAQLNRLLVRADACVVVSATMRITHDDRAIERMLRLRGAPDAFVLGHTPGGGGVRGPQIQAWLDAYRVGGGAVESFVILDDSGDMAHLAGRLVRTNGACGLQDADVARAVAMLED